MIPKFFHQTQSDTQNFSQIRHELERMTQEAKSVIVNPTNHDQKLETEKNLELANAYKTYQTLKIKERSA